MTVIHEPIKTALSDVPFIVSHVKAAAEAEKPVQVLRHIKSHLAKLGFAVSPENRKDGTFTVTYEAVRIADVSKARGKEECYQPATILSILKEYKEAIKDSGVKHNAIGGARCPIAKFKRDYETAIVANDLQKYVDAINPGDPVNVIAKAIFNLLSVADDDVKVGIYRMKVYSQAYYWVSACSRKLQKLENAQRKERKEARVGTSMKINPDYVLKVAEEILSEAKALKPAQIDYKALTVALVAASGRRTAEIIKTAKFTRVKGNDNAVKFTGLLKQKNRNVFGLKQETFEIPTLLPAGLVIAGLKKLRSCLSDHRVVYKDKDGNKRTGGLYDAETMHDTRHTESVSKTLVKSASDRSEQLFNSGDMRTYLLRHAYTEIGYSMGFNKKGENRSDYRRRVLCHADDRSQSVYDSFELSTEIEQFEAAAGENAPANKKLLVLLAKAQEIADANTRAKGVQRLVAMATEVAKRGGAQDAAFFSASWARAQVVDSKKVGKYAADNFASVIAEASKP